MRFFSIFGSAVSVIIIWILFILMVIMGFVLSLLAAPLGKLFGIEKWTRYASNNVQSLDRAAATAWGWDGHKTISEQCAQSDGIVCKATCRALSFFLEFRHCEKYLEKRGLK